MLSIQFNFINLIRKMRSKLLIAKNMSRNMTAKYENKNEMSIEMKF